MDPLSAPAPHPLTPAAEVARVLGSRLRAAIKGRDEVINLILTALFADGHVLLEDYPGSGKTTLAKALGESISDASGRHIAPFRRVQFTPDLLPSDITGVSIFDPPTGRFEFRPGPIFAHVLLADEINRTSPKVQSAMLESMAEKQVTVDNVTYPLDELFFVIATQNPRDLAGTYPLPVAQLDRFLFKINMDYIDRESEVEVLNTRRQRRSAPPDRLVSRDEVIVAR
ncbi:MAG: AAA family ATPase, partial [Acidobacteriota bacterium]